MSRALFQYDKCNEGVEFSNIASTVIFSNSVLVLFNSTLQDFIVVFSKRIEKVTLFQYDYRKWELMEEFISKHLSMQTARLK